MAPRTASTSRISHVLLPRRGRWSSESCSGELSGRLFMDIGFVVGESSEAADCTRFACSCGTAGMTLKTAGRWHLSAALTWS